ncbi:MAG: ABC transporter permease, partial [Acidobacteria bacterium]|nr:ABC transporter permease [Acidobacteriota bacterium]
MVSTAPALPKLFPKGESYWDLVLRQFRRNRLAVIALTFVLILFLVAIGAPFLASNRPIILVGTFQGVYQDRFQEWKFGGHPELMDVLRSAQGAPDPVAQTRLSMRLRAVERQLRYLASQLPAEPAAILLKYVEEYRKAVQMALSGLSAELPAQTQLLEKYSQEISQEFDPASVVLEEKLYWPVLSSLTAIDFFFFTVAVLLLFLPLWRRAMPRTWRESWKAHALVVLFPAVLLAGLRMGQASVFETIDYKGQLRAGAIQSRLALFPPIPYGINEDHLEDKYQAPGTRYWIGTDGNGRDLLARMIWGSRISLSVGFVAVAIYVVIGILVGTVAGYFRGWVDMALSRVIEIVICFPTFFLILAVLAFLQPSLWNIMVVIGITGWTAEARLIRGEFLRLNDQEFVLAAKGLGVSDARIIFRHILPNGLAPVLVAASFGVASAILIESGLSFLGFGISIPVPSWGGILNEARENFRYWWITLFPGLAIFSTVTAYNLVGEGIRDAID